MSVAAVFALLASITIFAEAVGDHKSDPAKGLLTGALVLVFLWGISWFVSWVSA